MVGKHLSSFSLDVLVHQLTYSVGSGFKELFKPNLRTVVGTDLSTSMLEHQQAFPLPYHVQIRSVSSSPAPEDSREQAREAPCH
jgi:hypothetical protein